MSVNGFIFDFDGLMVDTEQDHFDAWQQKFNEFGFSLSMDDWCSIVGTGPSGYSPSKDLYNRMHGKIDQRAIETWVHDYINSRIPQLTLLPGIDSFIRSAHKLGYKLAVASSSSYGWVAPFLEKFGITSLFSAVLTSNDVTHVKPDPELYRLALQQLGLSPAEAVVFEDSRNGLLAAKAAGIYSVAVPNGITRNMDLSPADRIVDSFTQLTPQEFKHLI